MRHVALALAILLAPGCGQSGSSPLHGGADGADGAGGPGPGGGDGGAGSDGAWQVDGSGGGGDAGAGDGSGSGGFNVFVVDRWTARGIPGAQVRVGAAEAASPLLGVTDGNGLAVLDGSALSGPQVVTASANGYVAATWFGVDNATVTVRLIPTMPAVAPTATVSGTIRDWNTLPAPPGNFLIAAVWYSFTHDREAPENYADQGMIVRNVCVRVLPTDPCNWSLKTRIGKLAVFTAVIEQDTNGTPMNTNDDTLHFRGYAIERGYDLDSGELVSGQELVLIADTDLWDAQVTYDTPPPSLVNVSWIPELQLGEEGQIPFMDVTGEGLRIPALTGNLSSASYTIEATAMGAQSYPQAVIWAREADVSTTVDLGAWLDPPQSLDVTGGTYSFDPVAGASLHAVDLFDTSAGTLRWSVLLLDGATSFELPSLSPDPLEADVDMVVRGVDLGGFVPEEFVFEQLILDLDRSSATRASFP